jgi:hypothetical protein
MNLISEHLFKKKKREKEIAMARTTVESYVKSIMPQEGLVYNLTCVENGVILKIKMDHRRMIQVRLNRLNYIKTLQNIIPIVHAIMDNFNKIGSINVRVGYYHYTENWVESEQQSNE